MGTQPKHVTVWMKQSVNDRRVVDRVSVGPHVNQDQSQIPGQDTEFFSLAMTKSTSWKPVREP